MIPDFQSMMLPVLKLSAEGSVSITEALAILAERMGISAEEQKILLPSGKKTKIYDRMTWAKSYLKKAGLVSYPARGQFEITPAGQAVLAQKPSHINIPFLQQFEEFRASTMRQRPSAKLAEEADAEQGEAESADALDTHTPEESLRLAYKAMRDRLAEDLLDRVLQQSPDFFERLVVDLIRAMGYGGGTDNAGRTLGRSGDNGVDGVIDQDVLGVDQIYMQAKRYDKNNPVGANAIRDFFGSLNLVNAQKGVFVTTSYFTAEAQKTVEKLSSRIVMIDGNRLADLMITYNIGCRDEETLHLKKMDSDYFDGITD